MHIFGALLIFSFAWAVNASTISEKRAVEMVTILNSVAVQSLFQKEDGVGYLSGISFVQSMTEVSSYRIQFSSYSALVEQTCISTVSIVDSHVTINSVNCENKGSSTGNPPKVCSRPSPVGCKDN